MAKILLAQNYNCSDSSASAYGESAYGTCATDAINNGQNPTTGTDTTTTQPGTVGAPNTGEFFGFVTSGAFSIILPLVVAIAIVAAASVAVVRKKRTNQR